MVEIRTAIVSDYPAIARIHSDNWRLNYRGIYSDSFLDNQVEQERLKVWCTRMTCPAKDQKVRVATTDGLIIGFSCLYLNEDAVFGSYLDNLHVSKTNQRMGIGKMLLQDCARAIAAEGDNKMLYLWVYEANAPARQLYERLGAAHVETIEKHAEDSSKAQVCRYFWPDLPAILSKNSG
jgi:ribosomal protein S18 acetylase RimI-like enzyme